MSLDTAPEPPPAKVATAKPEGSLLIYGLAAALLALATVWATLPLVAGRGNDELSAPAGIRVSPAGVYNPVLAGEPLPDGFRQVLPRDAIAPVYEPRFVSPSLIDWEPGTQVIGVEIDGEAKAYPVSFLNGREMVIDEIADIPIVVTW